MSTAKRRLCEAAGRVRVAGRHEPDAALARLAEPARLQVEPAGVAVHLDGCARARDRVQHRVHVALDRRPAQHVAARAPWPQILNQGWRMAVTMRCVMPAAVHPVALVDARDDDVELLDQRGRAVERPSSRMSHSVPRSRRTETRSCTRAISSHCRRSRSGSEAVRVVGGRRVVGDRHVRKPHRVGRARHLLEGVAAVGGVRVAVHGALQVFAGHEARQLAPRGRARPRPGPRAARAR